MKIIIPVVDDKEAKNELAGGFHNAEYACIYDCDSEDYEWLLVSEITKKPGNLSIELKKQGINIVISNSMPIMALTMFRELGLLVYKAGAKDVESNVKLYLDKKLGPLTFFNLKEEADSSCNSSCSSCSSNCSI